MPNLRIYAKFEKSLIFLTSIRHISKFWDFSKKIFFQQILWKNPAEISSFLIFIILKHRTCATCPKINIFIWDNILVLRMLKYDFLCMYGYVAQKFFIFYFKYGILEANVISAGFAYRIWLIFLFFFEVKKILPKIVCHMSENQKFYLRQHFST